MGSDDPAVKQWSRFNSHVAYKDVETIITIPYDANGGTGAPESVTAKAGTRITISDIEPARKGYTFLGWATNSAAITAVYKAGDTYVVQESITFYAVWQKDVFAEGYEFQLIAQTKTSATVSVKNNAGAATAATLILASYNVEGKQVSCQMKEIHLLTGATERITVSFTREDGVSEIRCFLTDTDDCVPLYEYWETEI